ncbi:HdeD family acid-resistance protein [Halorussus salinus]|uniref:HdeD family acid-resistance protein n=1 Tax=Halorussus salinus TaxID=1364935 RepID=UPI001091C9CC|nr:HdeD family acid-resistance protein [Halorussus salinus]
MSSNTTFGVESTRIGSRRAATVGGIVIAVLGLFAVVFPFFTGLSLSILLGALLVVGALVHAAHAFSAGSLGNFVWQVLLAGLYAVAGISFMANPVVGLATLTVLAIGFFLADGVVELVWGFQSRGEPGSKWLLASGAISLLFGGLLWTGFPTTAFWAVGVLLGVNLLATGVSLIVVGRGAGAASDPEVSTGKQGQQM